MVKINRYTALSKLSNELFSQDIVEKVRQCCGVRTIDDFIRYVELGAQKGFFMEVTGWYSGHVDRCAEGLDKMFPDDGFVSLFECFENHRSPFTLPQTGHTTQNYGQGFTVPADGVPSASLPQLRMSQ